VLRLTDADGKPLQSQMRVHIEQTRHAFLFGSNVFKLGTCGSAEANTAYEKRFADLLNYATLPFYWWGYEKEQGKPDYDKTKKMVRWCAAHSVTTKGHPLAWNYVDPKWLPDDPKEVLRLQLDRIEQCTRHFAGQIDIWDVVNEATHYDREGCKRNSPKLTGVIHDMGVGPFVRAAFQAARKGNPKAVLVINDYETSEEYATRVIDKLVDEQGKPMYDVIGIQCHQHGRGLARNEDLGDLRTVRPVRETAALYRNNVPLRRTRAGTCSNSVERPTPSSPGRAHPKVRNARRKTSFVSTLSCSAIRRWKRSPGGISPTTTPGKERRPACSART